MYILRTIRPHLTHNLRALLQAPHRHTPPPKTLPTSKRTIIKMSSSTQNAPSKGFTSASAMQTILETSQGEDWQAFLVETMRSISAPLAQKMLSQIGLLPPKTTTEPYRLLEQGCGMGVVAPLLHETLPREVQERSSVVCGDFSGPLVEAVKGRIEREGWVNCEARVVDATVSGSLSGLCCDPRGRIGGWLVLVSY